MEDATLKQTLLSWLSDRENASQISITKCSDLCDTESVAFYRGRVSVLREMRRHVERHPVTSVGFDMVSSED